MNTFFFFMSMIKKWTIGSLQGRGGNKLFCEQYWQFSSVRAKKKKKASAAQIECFLPRCEEKVKFLHSSVTAPQNALLAEIKEAGENKKRTPRKNFSPRCTRKHTHAHKGWSMETQASDTHTHTHTTDTSCTSAAKEGFIPRLLESDISMALSGVSMAIPCTEIIRGDPRLGPGSQRGQIYISSRAVKTPSLLYPSLPALA